MELDHLVINVRDRMDDAARTFEDLGFLVTPPSLHTLGSLNRTVVFDTSYIELLGFPPGKPPAARPELGARAAGPLALVFRTADADATHRLLASGGFMPRPVQAFARPVSLGVGEPRDAGFRVTRLEPDAVLGAWIYFCQHLTPELIWRPEWRQHPNRARAITRIGVAVHDTAGALSRYSLATGAALLHGSEPALRLADGCRLDFLRPDASRAEGIATVRIRLADDAPGSVAHAMGLRLHLVPMAQS